MDMDMDICKLRNTI
uniref:Uncharacterized protein n=1 Tax=Anguilla anguilla TaxID=7936 RepID=A0A0E9V3X2_ANGAN